MCPHMEEGIREPSEVSDKGTNPIHEGSTLEAESPPKAPLLNSITLWVRFQNINLGVT